MEYRRYLAELLGTFTLTFVVWLSVAFAMPYPTPVMAALTLGLLVYTLGPISGTHINPAVTVGLLSIDRIKMKDACGYIAAQFAGAFLAMFLGRMLSGEMATVPHESHLIIGVAEAIGAFFLVFGITSVVEKKVDGIVSGFVIGGSLLLGIYLALPFSNGILNPAVALGVGSFGTMYILGPLVGAVCGAWAAKLLHAPAGKPSRK